MHLPHLVQRYRNWKYKNTGLLLASIGLFFLIKETQIVHDTISHVGSLGYFGVFATGVFYVSAFTVAPALAVLYEFTTIYSPITIALVGGLGSVFGDLIIFRFVRDRVIEELKPLFHKIEDSFTLYHLFHTPYFFWLTPILGALIVASPFPDELGISMLGLSRIKLWQFVGISAVLDVAGILVVLQVVRLF